MRHSTRIVATALIAGVGIVVGLGVGRALTKPPTVPLARPPIVETALLRTDPAGLPGTELIVSRFLVSPGRFHGRHYHAGHELVYVLDGDGVIQADGESALSLSPGAVAYMAPGRAHAGGNASRTSRFAFLLVRIHKKGEAVSVELE